jgi:iron complex outermembrane receptor protein
MGYKFNEDTNLRFSLMRIWGSSSYDDPHTYLKDPAGNPVWEYFVGGNPPNVLKEAMFLTGKIAKDYTVYSLNFETKIKEAKVKMTLGLFDQDDYLFTTPCVGNSTGCDNNEYATRGGGPGTTRNNPGKTYVADLQVTLPISLKTAYFNNHILTFGASYKRAEAETKQYKLSNWKDENSKTSLMYELEGKDRIFALFIQDEIPVTQKLTLYIGARQDWWKTFDGYENYVGNPQYPKEYKDRSESSFNPKFSFVYNFSEKTVLRSSVGRAFRPPVITELYRSFMSPRSFVYGNPNLKTEKCWSWDLGIRHSFWEGNKVEISYFENYLKDLIYSRTTSQYIGTRAVVETVNAGKAEVKGVEFSIEQKFGKYIRTFANLTWNDARIKDNQANPRSEGKRITGIPETMFNAGIEVEKGPFSAYLVGRYRSKVYINDENKDRKEGVMGSFDSYFIADAKLAYKIFKNASLSLSVDNLFDKKYYYYYLEPRRSWFLEVSYKF